MAVGLLLGLLNGLFFASQRADVWIGQLTLRFRLSRAGLAPWQYIRFLDYAANRSFLRRVGDGYIFAHRVLMEYFATQGAGAPLGYAKLQEFASIRR